MDTILSLIFNAHSKMSKKQEEKTEVQICGATQNFREFEYTAQTVSATNMRR